MAARFSDAHPRYHGKPLLYWVARYRREPSEEEPRAAIRALKEAAIPFVIEQFSAQSRSGGTGVVAQIVFTAQIEVDLAAREDALCVVEALRTDAHPALPSIVAALQRRDISLDALRALRLIEPSASRAFARAWQKGDSAVRCSLIKEFSANEWNSQSAVIARQFISDPDPRVRKEAFSSLFCISTDVATHQGFLLESLNDRDRRVRLLALEYLTAQPAQIHLALDLVKPLTNDVFCRTQACCALRAAGLVPDGPYKQSRACQRGWPEWHPAKSP